MIEITGNELELDCGIPCARITSWLEDDLGLASGQKRSNGAADETPCSGVSADCLDDEAGQVASTECVHCYTFTDVDTSCEICLTPQPARNVGKVEIQRTKMEIAGDKIAMAAFLHLFTLKFISAGG